MELLVIAIVLAAFIFFIFYNLNIGKKDKEKGTGERSAGEGMTPSVPSPVTHISPTNLQNVNTIYIYTPDLSGTMFRKWVCRCCETENDATQSFCVLCGSASGRYGRGVYAFEQNYETEDPDADPFLEDTSLVYHSH